MWGPNGVTGLSTKPITPTAFKRAFSAAGVEVEEDGSWIYELRLLGMSPQVYCLGAKPPHEDAWRNLQEFIQGSVHVWRNLNVQDVVRGPLIFVQ